MADETDRRTKFQSELFENFDLTISVLIHSAHNSEYARAQHTQSGYRLKVMVFTSIYRVHVDGRKATCERAFFLKTEKKIAF